MTAFPPVIGDSIGEGQSGIYGRSSDPTKYLISRNSFVRPRIWIPDGPSFEWPLGVEGMRVSGTISGSEHLYIGDNAVVVQVTHRDNRRIEMRGVLPGVTGAQNMRDLLEVLTGENPLGYWWLSFPVLRQLGRANSIFPKEQQVVPRDYDFNHEEEDNSDSFLYTISFSRVGVGKRIKERSTRPSPSNPATSKAKPKGNTGRVFTVRAGARTLRAIAQVVYSNPERWREIYNKNTKVLNSLNAPLHSLPTKVLTLGLKLNY